MAKHLILAAMAAYAAILYAGPEDWCTIVAFDAQRYESMIWHRAHPPCD